MNAETVVYCVHDALWIGAEARDGRGCLFLIDVATAALRLFEYLSPLEAVLELARIRVQGGGEPVGWFARSVSPLETESRLEPFELAMPVAI